MKIKDYSELAKICGGTITPTGLKAVYTMLEFQSYSVKQQFWDYMFEMGEAFGDIQAFVVQDRNTSKEIVSE